ncbi:hypothetical protein IKG48_03485 [Candidatus Saccharibacteria bacterium]|nr:hypothetical protein [Candidatus Saccharibacteria bacterium]
MQLIRTLLIAATIVVILSGISIFFGSSRKEKKTSIYFLLATIGASIWTIAIFLFLNMPKASPEFVRVIVACIIGGITLCDVGLLAFLSWHYKGGKTMTFIFTIIGALLVTLVAYDPSLFYSSVDLSKDYAQLFVEHNWYYFALIAYFFLISITFSSYLMRRIKETANPSLKTGLKVFYIGLSIGGILALIFDLILITALPNLVWIGPMATIISIMSFYYSVVKSRTLSISSRWMEVMSYILLIATAIIIYVLAFYIVFTAMFSIPNPSVEILILNVVMAIFLLLLMPIMIELTNFMKASFFSDKIELGYIMKKLDTMDSRTFDPRDTARFLTDTLHYESCVLIISKHAYATDNTKFTTEEINTFLSLKPVENQNWVDPANIPAKDGFHISEMLLLKNSKGKEIGALIFGKRISERHLTKRDFIKIEAVANMISAIAEESHK